MKITFTVTNNNPDTIWNKLAARLGRDPTNEECRAECHKIMDSAVVDLAGKGRLPMQRRRA